jgi:hypothetical protein
MGDIPPSPVLQTRNVDFEIEPNTRNAGIFSLYFIDRSFSFEWIPDPSRDPKELLSHNIPPKVTVQLTQISQIRRLEVSIGPHSAVVLHFQLSDRSSFPRLIFNTFPHLFVTHFIEFLVFKRLIRPISSTTFIVLDSSSQTAGPNSDDFTLTPQQIVEIAKHNKILKSMNFNPLSKPPGPPLKVVLEPQDFSVLKRAIFLQGLDPASRPVVWPILFGALPFTFDPEVISAHLGRITAEYLRIQEQWALLTTDQIAASGLLQDIQRVIENDVKRNDRRSEAFAGDDNPNLRVLQRSLTAYAIFNRDTSYVQGMNDLLSPLIVLYIHRWDGNVAVFYDGARRSADETEAFLFWNFVGMMELTQHERLFTDLAIHQAFVLERSAAIATAVHQPLKKLLKSSELTSISFLFRPMILMYKRAFKNSELWRLWDSIFTSESPACFTRFVSAAILILLFPKLLLHTNGTLGEVMSFADGFLEEVDSQSVLSLASCLMAKLAKPHPGHDFVYEPVPDRTLYRKYVPQFLHLN